MVVNHVSALECELVSELTGTRAGCSVERRGQSLYEINYQPMVKGTHQLDIKVGDQHVNGSPFRVKEKSPVEKLSTSILTIEDVNDPQRLAINQRGELVVTERRRRLVSVQSQWRETSIIWDTWIWSGAV